MIRKD